MLCRLSLRNDHLKPISTHSAQACKTVLRLKFSVFNKAFKQLWVHHRRVRRHARLRGHGQFIFCNLSWKHRRQPCALQRIDELFCIVQIPQLIYLSVLCIWLSQLCEKNIKIGVQKSASYCPARLQHPLCATAPPCFDGIRRFVLTKFLENYGGKKCQRRRCPRRRQRFWHRSDHSYRRSLQALC